MYGNEEEIRSEEYIPDDDEDDLEEIKDPQQVCSHIFLLFETKQAQLNLLLMRFCLKSIETKQAADAVNNVLEEMIQLQATKNIFLFNFCTCGILFCLIFHV